MVEKTIRVLYVLVFIALLFYVLASLLGFVALVKANPEVISTSKVVETATNVILSLFGMVGYLVFTVAFVRFSFVTWVVVVEEKSPASVSDGPVAE